MGPGDERHRLRSVAQRDARDRPPLLAPADCLELSHVRVRLTCDAEGIEDVVGGPEAEVGEVEEIEMHGP